MKTHTKRLVVHSERSQYDRWTERARIEGKDLSTWVRDVLDREAASPPGLSLLERVERLEQKLAS